MVKTMKVSVRSISGLIVRYLDGEVESIGVHNRGFGTRHSVIVPGMDASQRSRRGRRADNYFKETDHHKLLARIRRRAF